ncbi:phage portal protein [Aeoliella mucimassa]|uniref:Phage portal protein, lambda family n=1 Tax=Aeoliella mucimassa TaxID=2527972 RepID=A0A518AHW9_9BACT|nr:phage portal protein [Aeoliella mucimassa]QDU54319.1 Phage portal protein, lambda family [Aeoliella mucimassa]
MKSDHLVHQRLQEAFELLWSDFVDPRDAFAGDDGLAWQELSAGAATSPIAAERLADVRQQCRELLVSNEFAINGIENRISYIVGPGHTYQAVVRKHATAPESLASEVQQVIDEFLETNDWHNRQQEIVRRTDRDGEAFIRLFATAEGATQVRFVEPEQVATPNARFNDPAASLGILTSKHDVETVHGYFVDGELVPAAEVQHRRANVDRNVKRGLPLYLPVRKNLRRAEKLLRNMSMVAEIQSAIALIRKHRAATRTGVEQFVVSQADATVAQPSGRIEQLTQYGPGTILDAPSHVEYEFPATGVDASAFVEILQAELRAIAARLVMPEFMFTSDASNANYASTMVAEGPAVRMFERLQAGMTRDDAQLLWRVIDHATTAGRLPVNVRQLIDVQITPPTLVTRDALREARVMQMAYENRLVSPQTWSRRLGLDYEQEQQNLRVHEKQS